jgi:hypothetical protein
LDEEKEEKEPEEAYTGDATHVKAGHRLLSLFRQTPPPPPLRPGVEGLFEPENTQDPCCCSQSFSLASRTLDFGHRAANPEPYTPKQQEINPRLHNPNPAIRRSHSYIQDMFDYGRGGVFGARRGEGGMMEGGAGEVRGRWMPMGGQLLAQESPEYIEKVMTPR